MKILQSIEEHPYVAAAGVFIGGLLLLYIIFSGSSAQPATVVAQPQSDTGSATQLAMAQLAAQASTANAVTAAGAQANTNAASVSIAQLNAATQQNHDLTQYQTQTQVATSQKDALIGQSTISANMNMHIADDSLTGLINSNSTQLAAIKDSNATQLSAISNNNALASQEAYYNFQIAGYQNTAEQQTNDTAWKIAIANAQTQQLAIKTLGDSSNLANVLASFKPVGQTVGQTNTQAMKVA